MAPLLFWMLVGHALADYPLQGDFLAKAKNHRQPIPGVPWIHGLFWHAMIHGGAVALATGSLVLGCAEIVAHMAIDHAKCAGLWQAVTATITEKLTPGWRERAERRAFHIDQALHVVCKIAWALIVVYA